MRAVWPSLLIMGVAGCANVDATDAPRGDAAHPAGGVAAWSSSETGELPDELEEIRRLTERFRDVDTALAEGYVRDPSDQCVTAPMEGMPRQLGAMGIHYLRPDLLGLTAPTPRVDGNGTHTDFRQPAILVYVPGPEGTLELAAVENLVWEKAWREAGNRSRPSFLGQEYWLMVDNPQTAEMDEAHGFEPHYELHIWLHEENPSGLFFPFNPAVSCAGHRPAT